ncbi:Tetratricopeptide repeat protein 8 [Portunus trituberculatus]|uniref:Tetratricopeptide repeat protein 8 n=1 Tax=Portunus trituberculatus TaxID=210409 RepID=A0A5B7EXC3_PORTR|nr:Tetratricopeptide repeat protein 8 [Portunus trituberculatus]
MDPLFLALSCFRRRKFDRCIKICTELLSKNPYDQVRATNCLYSHSFGEFGWR